jgi:hypothetical protein
MPGGIPKTGIFNASGKPILSRDPRFNHTWISSRGVYFYDNETCDDIVKCAMVPPDATRLGISPAFLPNRMPYLPVLPI